MKIESAKELEVYQIAYALAMQVFEVSKSFPVDERWGVCDKSLLEGRNFPLRR